jgi:hypothetical protein
VSSRRATLHRCDGAHSCTLPPPLLRVVQATDLGNVTLRGVHQKSVVDIANELQREASRMRAGKNVEFQKSKPLLRSLPTWIISAIAKWASCHRCRAMASRHVSCSCV